MDLTDLAPAPVEGSVSSPSASVEGSLTPPGALALGEASQNTFDSADNTSTGAGGRVDATLTPSPRPNTGGAGLDSLVRKPCCLARTAGNGKSGIQWGSLIQQEFIFLGIQHGFRLATEPKTRQELGGPFFADWVHIMTHTQWSRWSDGDKLVTSYLGHSAQGSITAWIYRQNDTNARNLEQDFHNPAYRKMLLKAFAVATVTGVLWKIGPLSEATIGHVGLYPTVNKWGLPTRDGNRSGLNDYVLNEVGGVPLMMGEDWLDKHVASRLERHIQNVVLTSAIRIFTSPTRSLANVTRFKKPWYRDNRDSR